MRTIESLRADLNNLEQWLDRHRPQSSASKQHEDQFADVDIFYKGAYWALRFDEGLTAADLELIDRTLVQAWQRADALTGKSTASAPRGKFVQGFISEIDGSTQPYGVVLPSKFQAGVPARLDVVLHGSMPPRSMSYIQFLDWFRASGDPPDNDFIELHPLGRVENNYRWAGEADVFEAIEAMCRRYAIDRNRIVLRGFSMGASGTWHLGLKHPDRFAALGPYAGYVETHTFSRIWHDLNPQRDFPEVGELPPLQEKLLHLNDAIDYAANAAVVPVVAAMGEKDVVENHRLMQRAMHAEGVQLVQLNSLDIGHTIDPVTMKEQMRLLARHAQDGLPALPRTLRFVTWTLKYSRCHWIQLLGLKEHFQRACIEARLGADNAIEVVELQNVTRFAILPYPWHHWPPAIRILGQPMPVARERSQGLPQAVIFTCEDGRWVQDREQIRAGKVPGLQGPIDDAFTGRFLCVRGTGKPWHPRVHAWASARLDRFADEWARYMRGELPIKNDREVTADDIAKHNLILFGDPGSNALIGRALSSLPIRWTEKALTVNGASYSAGEHVPLLIYPCRLPGSDGRYVVLNRGHTFSGKEFARVNYLLFPRLGDHAVIKLGPSEEQVVVTDVFDEDWAFKAATTAK